MARDTVLVTGGSGFVGSHVILQLLDAGYVVRTTLRSLAKADVVRDMLRDAGVDRRVSRSSPLIFGVMTAARRR